MDQKPVINSSFEAAVVLALHAIKAAAQQSPGFNVDAMVESAKTSLKYLPPEIDKDIAAAVLLPLINEKVFHQDGSVTTKVTKLD